MVEGILKLFVSEQQAQSILTNSLIEFMFMLLFFIFAAAFITHFILYGRLRRIRNHLYHNHSLDIDPLNKFKAEFDERKQRESVKVETFVQNKFSSWRVVNIPVVNLIKMIQMTVSILILIGVLGTFIGLAMSLGSIDGTGDQLVENVASVLAGLHVAFYTSIAGMGLSTIMTMVTKIANAEYMLTDIMLKMESYLEENEQDTMAKLIDVSQNINGSIVELRETNQKSLQNIEKAFHGFQEYTVGLQQSAKDLAKFNEGLSANLKDFTLLFTNVKKVTDGLDGSVSMLNKNFDQLFSYFNKMDKRNERMTNAFQETYKRIEELTSSQMETLNNFQESVEDWREYINGISDRQEAIHGSFERMIGQSDTLVKMMKENNKQFRGIFGDDLGSKLAGISSYLKELRHDFDKLGNSVVRLPDALETINMAQGEFRTLFSDRFEEMREFNREFNNHLKAHATESNAFEKHVGEASRSYEQMAMKNNQLINDIGRTVSQINDSFQHRENQLESSVGVLKDTLSRYVASLEGTLGDRLDKVGRSIGDYVVDMNDAIKREFKQMGDMAEDHQQRNARYTQQTLNDLSQEFQNLNRQLQAFIQEVARQRVPQTQPQDPMRHVGTGRVRIGSND